MAKLSPTAVTPTKKHTTDAGYDLTAIAVKYNKEEDVYVIHTGIAIELPPNTVGLIFPRSSIARTDLVLSNSVGVIDQDYRGEILFKFKPINGGRIIYKVGERVGQLVIMPLLPHVEVQEVSTEQLSMTDRGTGGFGSTGA